MEKIKVFTKKVNRLNQTLVTSFGNVEIDGEGFAEIDVKNQEQALEIGFELVDPLKGGSDQGENGDNSPPLTPEEEREALKISLFKKKNEVLQNLLKEAGVPETEFEGKVKKELVELLLEKLIAKEE